MKSDDIQDWLFGELRWDSQVEWFEGSVEWAPEHVVDVFFLVKGAERSQVIARAREIFATVRDREPEYPGLAAQSLLPRYNRYWREKEPIDAAAFVARMRLGAMEICSNGSVGLIYEDGARFGGHHIVVEVLPHLTFKNACIEG